MGLSTPSESVIKGRFNYLIGAIIMNICVISVRAVNNLSIYYLSFYARVNNMIIKSGVSFFMGP